jgi:hypothetical protein
MALGIYKQIPFRKHLFFGGYHEEESFINTLVGFYNGD